MYEELIKKLRYCGNAISCVRCPYWVGCGGTKEYLTGAADAIEKLNTFNLMWQEAAKITLEEVPKWIPVTERLPEERINPNTNDFEYVLCATIWGDVRPFKYGTPIGSKGAHFWNGVGYVDAYVTHWMPLPEPPEEEVKDDKI